MASLPAPLAPAAEPLWARVPVHAAGHTRLSVVLHLPLVWQVSYLLIWPLICLPSLVLRRLSSPSAEAAGVRPRTWMVPPDTPQAAAPESLNSYGAPEKIQGGVCLVKSFVLAWTFIY